MSRIFSPEFTELRACLVESSLKKWEKKDTICFWVYSRIEKLEYFKMKPARSVETFFPSTETCSRLNEWFPFALQFAKAKQVLQVQTAQDVNFEIFSPLEIGSILQFLIQFCQGERWALLFSTWRSIFLLGKNTFQKFQELEQDSVEMRNSSGKCFSLKGNISNPISPSQSKRVLSFLHSSFEAMEIGFFYGKCFPKALFSVIAFGQVNQFHGDPVHWSN